MIWAIIAGLATILGGVAAIWFFVDKFRSRRVSTTPSAERLEQIILDSNPSEDWNRESGSFGGHVVTTYKNDVNLRFEIKYTDDGIQCREFSEDWAIKHPHPSATGYFCDLYFGSSLIKRSILVSVDGGRAMLPLPKKGQGSDPSSFDEILPLDYRVAQIHDDLGTLDEYVKRSGLRVID